MQDPPTSRPAPATLIAEPSLSIFQQPWWLDAAADRNWGEAVVRDNAIVVGRLPYPIGTRFGLPVSTLTRLIPTLGPAIQTMPGKAATAFKRRLEITHALIDQLPQFAFFAQTFDHRITDAAAFVHRGFVATAADCFRIPQGRTPQDVWCSMQAARRQQIVDAASEFRIEPVDDVDELFRLDRRFAHGNDAVQRVHQLFQSISERDAGIILGARDRRGTLVAALVVVWESVNAHRLVAVRRADAPENAESMLLWEAMRRVLPRGLAFDFGMVESLASLRYLAGFGDYLTPRIGVRRVTKEFRLRKAVLSMFGTWAG